jgi:hypothetical protein
VAQDSSLTGCDTVCCGRNLRTFRTNLKRRQISTTVHGVTPRKTVSPSPAQYHRMSQIKNILTNKLLGKEGQSYREHCGCYGDINRAETGFIATVMWGVFILCENYGKNACVKCCCMQPSSAVRFAVCAVLNCIYSICIPRGPMTISGPSHRSGSPVEMFCTSVRLCAHVATPEPPKEFS